MYYKGEGVEQSSKESLNWLLKSVELGNSRAQKSIPLLIENQEKEKQIIFFENVKWFLK